MIGFINTIHCVLRPHMHFLSVFSLTYLLLALFKFFSSELVSGYHSRLYKILLLNFLVVGVC